MPRLVDADKLPHYDGTALSAVAVARAVEDAPSVDAVPLEDYKSMERTVNKLTKALADAAPVCCKDCIHRPQWKNREIYPPGYWGDDEAGIDWTCPLIDRNELRNSWYMDDDFYCPKGEES